MSATIYINICDAGNLKKDVILTCPVKFYQLFWNI